MIFDGHCADCTQARHIETIFDGYDFTRISGIASNSDQKIPPEFIAFFTIFIDL